MKKENFTPKNEYEPQPEKENEYDFKKVKQHIETLTTLSDKLSYLDEIKTDYLQNTSPWAKGFEVSFDRQCQLEGHKLIRLSKIKAMDKKLKAEPFLILADRTGLKIDLIRVLNALYELRFFTKTDGQIPSKSEFMKTMGEYLGVDLSKYHSNLSQALQNQPIEVNLKVFEEMKKATQKAHYETKTK